MPRKQQPNGEEGLDDTGGDPRLTMLPQRLGEEDNLDLIGDEDDNDDLIGGDEDPYAERFQALQDQIASQQENFQNILLQIASGQHQQGGQQQGGQQQSAPAGLNLDDLPDPVEDRAGFNRALGERLNGFVTQQHQATTTQAQFNQQLQDLESQFRRDYAELAEKPMLFQTAVQQEVQRYRTMGLDPRRAIFMAPGKFIKDVASRMYGELGIDPNGHNDDDGEQGGQQMQQQRKTVITKRSANRTTGVSRGSKLNGVSGGGKQGGKKPSGFIDQIKQQQLEEGLI